MLKMNEPQAKEFIAELAAKCDKRWKETVDKTRFMNELREGKLKKETLQLFYKNWGSFVPVINSVYTSAFYRHLWFFVKNVDLMEVYTQKVLDEFGHPCPPGHIQILIGTGEALGLSKEEVLLSDVARVSRAARFSPHATQRRTDSRILVFGSVGASFRQLLFGLLQGIDDALRSHQCRGELLFQASRSRHHGSTRPQGPWRGDTNRLGPFAPGRN